MIVTEGSPFCVLYVGAQECQCLGDWRKEKLAAMAVTYLEGACVTYQRDSQQPPNKQ
jgi:hypothetical protein